jgi:hypothetical protein
LNAFGFLVVSELIQTDTASLLTPHDALLREQPNPAPASHLSGLGEASSSPVGKTTDNYSDVDFSEFIQVDYIATAVLL